MDYYVGKILDGRYEIQEVLGVGGMAVVYRAYDNIDDRPVAVKVLKEEFLANEEFRRRFKNESKAIAMLSHPNIVKVYDVSYGERLQYIVMEYVEGITLKEYIEQRRVIPWKEAVHFLTQILRALQHAHDRGVVHRDIKPQNIMLLHSGNIKVTDFGIARFSRSETRTMGENAIGSVHYISPEQARGDLTDGKSDIYSVGVVLYEMLTGELPFQSDSTVSVAIMQLQTEPRRPRELNDAIPLGLEQTIIRAMQKIPADRYQSAAEMLLDLEEFKRNPLIRFEYAYFVDQEPTRYVSPMDRPRPQRPEANEDDDAEEETAKSRLVPMMAGIVAAVILVVAAVGAFIYFATTNDSNLIVRKFVDMKIVEINSNMTTIGKDYEIAIEWEESTTREPGIVFRQEPQYNTKQRRGSNGKVAVTLFVAKESIRPVPDVSNKSMSDAKRLILEAGFTVKSETELNLDVEQGKAIRTEPEAGAELAIGTEVTIFMAVKQIDDTTPVPDLVGWDVDTAKELLKSAGLALDPKIDEEDSDAEKGKVTWQSFPVGQEVQKGSQVKVRISNGVVPTRTAQLKIPVPNRVGEVGQLRIFLNGVMAAENTIMLNGEFSGSVEGTGSDVSIEALLDGTRVYTAKVDFTVNPPALSEERSYISRDNDNLPQVPNVVGMMAEQAVSTLSAAGFSDVEPVVQKAPSIFAKPGLVWSQSPAAGAHADYDEPITVYVNE